MRLSHCSFLEVGCGGDDDDDDDDDDGDDDDDDGGARILCMLFNFCAAWMFCIQGILSLAPTVSMKAHSEPIW